MNHRPQLIEQNQKNKLIPKQTEFEYTGVEQYIQIIEKSRLTIDNQSIVKTLILDQKLSIIQTTLKSLYDLPRQKQKSKQQSQKVQFLVENQTRDVIIILPYKSYPFLSDFHVGRMHWGRVQNSLRINNDLVSRYHCQILYNGEQNNQQQQSKRRFIDLLVKQSRLSSNLRKMQNNLWNKIFEYAKSKNTYSIQDKGSRNGTYIRDESKYEIELKFKCQYQFERQDYSIKIRSIKKGLVQIQQQIQNFGQKIQSGEWQRVKRSIDWGPFQNIQNVKNCAEPYAITIYFDFAYSNKYEFLVLNNGQKRHWLIGAGQDLSIFYNNHEFQFSKHGKLIFSQGKWMISPIISEERVWTRLEDNKECKLDTKKNYDIRIGHITIMEIRFHNYQ